MTKQSITERLVQAMGSRGLRKKLLSSSLEDQKTSTEYLCQSLRTSQSSESLTAKRLAASIIALAMDSSGSLSSSEETKWKNFGHSLRDAVDIAANESQLENRLVRLIDKPLEQASQLIFSSARLLISKGCTINFDNLYFDLARWDQVDKETQLKWLSSFYVIADS